MLRDDSDGDARREAACALVEALRPKTGWLFVELGDAHPAVPGLLARTQMLAMQQVNSTGVVWAGPSEDEGVWQWAVDALPWASCWELHDGPDDSAPLVADSADSLSAMWISGVVERADLRAWLSPAS
jgi:hypothetical protein